MDVQRPFASNSDQPPGLEVYQYPDPTLRDDSLGQRRILFDPQEISVSEAQQIGSVCLPEPSEPAPTDASKVFQPLLPIDPVLLGLPLPNNKRPFPGSGPQEPLTPPSPSAVDLSQHHLPYTVPSFPLSPDSGDHPAVQLPEINTNDMSTYAPSRQPMMSEYTHPSMPQEVVPKQELPYPSRPSDASVLQAMRRPENQTETIQIRRTREGRLIQYRLRVIQQPERARACGAGAKASADRRPVDPPPVVEMKIWELDATNQPVKDITFTYLANFFLFATLESSRIIAQGRVQPQPQQPPVLTGVPVAGVAYLDRPDPAGYFIFPDLSVRHEGWYRLSFNLYEATKLECDKDEQEEPAFGHRLRGPPMEAGEPEQYLQWRLDVKSNEFQVFSAKKFPGLSESTGLSRCVAEQGCRVRIRRDVRMRRREAKDGKDEDADGEDLNIAHTPVQRPRSISHNSFDNVGRYGDVARRQSQDMGTHYPQHSYPASVSSGSSVIAAPQQAGVYGTPHLPTPRVMTPVPQSTSVYADYHQPSPSIAPSSDMRRPSQHRPSYGIAAPLPGPSRAVSDAAHSLSGLRRGSVASDLNSYSMGNSTETFRAPDPSNELALPPIQSPHTSVERGAEGLPSIPRHTLTSSEYAKDREMYSTTSLLNSKRGYVDTFGDRHHRIPLQRGERPSDVKILSTTRKVESSAAIEPDEQYSGNSIPSPSFDEVDSNNWGDDGPMHYKRASGSVGTKVLPATRGGRM